MNGVAQGRKAWAGVWSLVALAGAALPGAAWGQSSSDFFGPLQPDERSRDDRWDDRWDDGWERRERRDDWGREDDRWNDDRRDGDRRGGAWESGWNDRWDDRDAYRAWDLDRGGLERELAELERAGRGARWVEFGSGRGLIASGSATYSVGGGNRRLDLLRQRQAMSAAHLDARRAMVELVNGLSIEARRELLSRVSTYDSELLSATMSDLSDDERIRSAVAGVLGGAVVVSVRDEPGSGRVVVTLGTSPRTLGGYRSAGRGVVLTERVGAAEELLFREIRSGVLPPVGTRVLTDPFTGETVWVSFGAEPVVTQVGSESARAAVAQAARQIARQRAQAGLSATLLGERVSGLDESYSVFEDYSRQEADLLGQHGVYDVRPGGRSVEEVFSRLDLTSERTSVTRGVLPPGVRSYSFLSDDGLWAYEALVYGRRHEPWLTRRGRDGYGEGYRDDRWRDGGWRDEGFVCDPRGAAANAVRVEARGTGRTREEAVRNALREAIQRVNGGAIFADERYRLEVDQAIGTITEDVIVRQRSREEIVTRSRGIIRSFHEVQWRSGPVYEVELCVDVGVYSEGWRGGASTLAVLRPVFGSPVVGCESPGALGVSAVSIIERALTREGSYRLVTRNQVDAIYREQGFIVDGILNGRVAPEEAISIGRLLGADYLFIPTVEACEYTCERVFNRARQREENVESLAVAVSATVVSAVTGEVVWSDVYQRRLRSADLERARFDGVLTNPCVYGITLASEHLSREAALFFKERGGRGHDGRDDAWGGGRYPTIGAVRGEIIALELNGSVVERGEVLEVLTTGPNGETRVARVEVTSVEVRSTVAFARLVEGRIDDVKPGLRCRSGGR